ncbi:MAG: CehA/McbA family metallohydrolase [Candidatus Binatia bacterium]|nr:CehA/McbA family metallohydrolase [Candidatus Binatia bacterium]
MDFTLPRLLLALVTAVLLIPATSHADGFYAGQITEENLERLPPGGLDAIGGTGDWFLTNGALCAVVSSREHPTYLSLHGGVLVDLWHCAKANDQWSTIHPVYNLDKEKIPPAGEILAGSSDEEAWVETRAPAHGLDTVTRYAFTDTSPGALSVTTTITRTEDGEPLQIFGNIILHPRGSLTPFTVDTVDGAFSRGFDQPEVDTSDPTSIVSTVSAADLQLLLGSRHIEPPISYGVQTLETTHTDAEGGRDSVMPFLMGGQYFTILGIFSEPFYTWGRAPGLLSFLRSRFFELEVGESLTVRQSIHVGDRADAASITDRIYRGPFVTGQLDTGEAAITVKDAEGVDLTFVRPSADGRFRFRLPAHATSATLVVTTPWSETRRTLETLDEAADLGRMSTGAVATLRLPRGTPMNLIFTKENQPQIFRNELTNSRIGGVRALTGPEGRRLSLAGSHRDPRSVRLAPGRYRVVAGRGPEYSMQETTIELTAGDTVDLEIEAPARAVDSDGLIGADFHVHSGVSFDSSLLPEHRILDFVAQGAEILVPTEHNITTDLQPTIEALGLADSVVSFPGVELTGMVRTPQAPTTIGHSNVFPVTADSTAFMGGTLPFEAKRLGQVIDSYKREFPNSIFQLNHPRVSTADDDIAFLDHLSVGREFDPDTPLTSESNKSLVQTHPGSEHRDIDFDAIEILSGEAMDGYEATRRDWFSLLNQGVYKVAMANSDSHGSQQLVALPRTYLAVTDDDPMTVTPADIVGAIRSGHVYGTTGPILRVALGETSPGGVHEGRSGVLNVRVDSAPWVPVDEVRIWIDGQLWNTVSIRSGESVSVNITADHDSFVFVEAAGSPSAAYEELAPGFTPFAFANPIFIDVDGNGWSPPNQTLTGHSSGR